MERVDVAVVGGGPAGSAAGHAAATRGAETIVLEKGVPRADRDGLGPDSTDAAGMLDYWVDIMDFEEGFPESVILQDLEGAVFHGPSESLSMTDTGIASRYPEFGFTFHRARFDDWLRERAEDAGASYRVGASVTGVETDLDGPTHRVSLAGGDDLEASHLVLADGPQRTVTASALDQFLPAGESVTDRLASTSANHIAYQEHRRMPPDLFEPDLIEFWWGGMPGHTAYPWIFPNDDGVARIGLTMPIGLDIHDYDRDEWALLAPDDESIPRGGTYVQRLLEREFPEYGLADFPLVEDRGKSGGTETYPISSTRPIESPTAANVAVAGGAMGTTSAFHEGGDHVAVATGTIAGELAAQDRLDEYNEAWQAAIGEEIARNVAMAELVADFGPTDWDRAFVTGRKIVGTEGHRFRKALAGGFHGLSLTAQYVWLRRRIRNGGYVKLREAEYAI
jgi:electron-transferring-flavoprotein dehydrogenase